jgi:hypothetical protein
MLGVTEGDVVFDLSGDFFRATTYQSRSQDSDLPILGTTYSLETELRSSVADHPV